LNDKIHSEIYFLEYIQKNETYRCPVDGVYSYSVDGEKIHCSVHFDSDDEEDEENKEVPWL